MLKYSAEMFKMINFAGFFLIILGNSANID